MTSPSSTRDCTSERANGVNSVILVKLPYILISPALISMESFLRSVGFNKDRSRELQSLAVDESHSTVASSVGSPPNLGMQPATER